MRVWITTLAMSILVAGPVFGANAAYDDASDPAYAGGWTNGSNGGFGFAPWQLLTFGFGSGQFALQSSTSNGDGDSNSDGDIDTAGVSWGLLADSYTFALAARPFTGGPLQPGQSVAIDFDLGDLLPGFAGGMGVGLTDALLLDTYFSLYQNTNSSTLFYNDALVNNQPIPLAVDDEGGRFFLVMLDASNYWAQVSLKAGPSYAWSGAVTGALEVVLFGHNAEEEAGSGSPYWIYANRLEVVPEATPVGLLAAGVLTLALRYIRPLRRTRA